MEKKKDWNYESTGCKNPFNNRIVVDWDEWLKYKTIPEILTWYDLYNFFDEAKKFLNVTNEPIEKQNECALQVLAYQPQFLYGLIDRVEQSKEEFTSSHKEWEKLVNEREDLIEKYKRQRDVMCKYYCEYQKQYDDFFNAYEDVMRQICKQYILYRWHLDEPINTSEILNYLIAFNLRRGELITNCYIEMFGSLKSKYFEDPTFSVYSKDKRHLEFIATTPTITNEFEREYLKWKPFISQISFFKKYAQKKAELQKLDLCNNEQFNDVAECIKADIDGITQGYCKALDTLKQRFDEFAVGRISVPKEIEDIFMRRGNCEIMTEFFKRCENAVKLKDTACVAILCELEALRQLTIIEESDIKQVTDYLNDMHNSKIIKSSFLSQFMHGHKASTKPNALRIDGAIIFYKDLHSQNSIMV